VQAEAAARERGERHLMRLAEVEQNETHAAQQREERRAAGQTLARGKPAARRKERWEATQEAQKLLDEKQAAISDAQRAQGIASRPARKLAKAFARHHRARSEQDDPGSSPSATPDTATERPVVALSRRRRGDDTRVQAIVAASATTATSFADRAYLSRSAGKRMMLDSGATSTLLTTVSAGPGGGGRGKEAVVQDAQGSTMAATSLGQLWATLVDSSGRACAHHLLDEQAFMAPGLVSDLLSMSGMAEAGWNFHITNYGEDSWAEGRLPPRAQRRRALPPPHDEERQAEGD